MLTIRYSNFQLYVSPRITFGGGIFNTTWTPETMNSSRPKAYNAQSKQ
ncbi:hypothetical protein FOCG_16692 [Fusarium oxysporum f. sp. radicis-lycopersici 26381]|nr:hypothetical protein FOCG_16692 [Fusarium oxysporum f. sp. radicis-lycopersici 26381]